jgi:hypothetical protein
MIPSSPDPLLEAVATAWRPRDAHGELQAHPGWYDLDARQRQEAFDLALANRAIEAALDPEGLSATSRAVLARIRR